MIFNWSLRNRKSPQIFRTLLSILADLNNAIVWSRFVVLFTILQVPFSKPLGIVPSRPVVIGITVTLIFHRLFSPLEGSKYLFIFSLSLSITLRSAKTAKFTLEKVLSFYNFKHLILQDRFWFVHILFSWMVKFQSLAKFSEDHFAHPVIFLASFSMVFVWQQVSSSFQDTFEFCRSQQCCSLDGFDSMSDF